MKTVMKASPLRLNKVFRSDVRLVVPLFQRPYVWNEDDQWAPLWEDIIDAFDRRSEDTPPHFLGAIVLEQRRGELGTLEVRDVIDGQQRLTTLQVLIAALRDSYLERHIQTRLGKQLAKSLENDLDYATTEEERYKLWPTNHDRAAFRSVIDGDFRATKPPSRAPRIVEAYKFFRDQITVFISPADSDDEAAAMLDGLTEVILHHLELVAISLDEDDNAQVIFESLNARGTPLRASDLIKNALFRTLQSKRTADLEGLYTRYWEPLESDYWKQEIRVGRLHRPRLDVFVGYFLTIILQREVLAHQLFPVARGYFSGDFDRALEFVQELSRYAEVFESLDSGVLPNDVENRSLTHLDIADTTTVRPVLLWLFANADGEPRKRAVALIESFLVRRTICRLTPKNYNRLFLELLKQLSAGADPVDHIVSTFLTGQASESGLWPTDVQVQHAMVSLPIYRLLKRDRLQQLLLAFEGALTTDRTEPIRHSKQLSVEHLLPQAWESAWPIPNGVDVDQETQRRDELMHTIGNLTLVTGKLNSALSNRPWYEKRNDILLNSAFSLNRSLPLEWDCTAIIERARWLADTALALWPRPLNAVAYEIAAADLVLAPDREGPSLPLSPRRVVATTKNDGTPRYSGPRRDIAAHIQSVFRDLAEGEFLTINEIANTPSAQYPADDLPSGGAINYRLFPKNGALCTVPGVVGAVHGGVRGGRKITE